MSEQTRLKARQGTAEGSGWLRLDEAGRFAVGGDWTLAHYPALQRLVDRHRGAEAATADLSALGELDTAGAALLARLLGPARLKALAESAELPAERRALLRSVADAAAAPPAEPPAPGNPLLDVLEHIGSTVHTLWKGFVQLLGFIGLTLTTLLALLPRPHRWRFTALVNQIEQTGFNAVPIVALLTFLVGAVVAFLGATVLIEFGAAIYTVDLVAYAFMREFGVLLAAIMLAGRTASAYTAQIGSMKANEEIDALRVQGLDPIEILVVPRMLALMITLPMLTFIAVICGLAGGAAVAILSLDISSTRFLAILATVPLQHFIVGIAKAPVFAVLIALIGCLEGFKVSGSAESVGAHTTSSVVQSIFTVILLDAVAAMFFMEMGW